MQDPAFENALWLRDLPRNLVSELRAAALTRRLSPGQRLSELGDDEGGLIGVSRGILALHTDDNEERDIVAHLFWPGDWIGVWKILSDMPRALGSSAQTEASVVLLPRSIVLRIAEDKPLLWRGLALASAENARIATRTARDALMRSPLDRCAATLERLAWRQRLPCEIPLTQNQVADVCGLSRGAVAKALATLERDGVVSRGFGSIVLQKGRNAADGRSSEAANG